MNPHGLKNSYYDRVVPSFNFSRSIIELPIITLLASYFGVTVHLKRVTLSFLRDEWNIILNYLIL